MINQPITHLFTPQIRNRNQWSTNAPTRRKRNTVHLNLLPIRRQICRNTNQQRHTLQLDRVVVWKLCKLALDVRNRVFVTLAADDAVLARGVISDGLEGFGALSQGFGVDLRSEGFLGGSAGVG